MTYLTEFHTTPPLRVQRDGVLIPTAPMIARDDVVRLAALGVYRHHPTTDPKPLGSEWVLIDGEYYEQPLGTPEQIQDALDAQEAASFRSAKLAAQSRRSALRLAHQTGGFTYDGHRYASDREESIPLLLNCVLAAQMAMVAGPESVAAVELALGDGWRSTDGVGRITTAAGILALHAAFVAHGAACDRHSQSLKALIDAAQSQAELDAIDLESGWPE